MKKLTIILALVIIGTLFIPGATSASSLGVTPPSFSITIPVNGENIMGFQIFYWTGEVEFTPVNLPVSISPSVIYVDENTGRFNLTFKSLDGQGKYSGYINVIGKSGGNVAIALSVNATVILSATIVPPSGGGGGGSSTLGFLTPTPTPTSTPTPTPAPTTTPPAPPRTTTPAPAPTTTPLLTTTPVPTTTRAIPTTTVQPKTTYPATATSTGTIPIEYKTNWWLWIIIIGAILLIAIGLFIWWWRKNHFYG
jgi:hypothetical protein